MHNTALIPGRGETRVHTQGNSAVSTAGNNIGELVPSLEKNSFEPQQVLRAVQYEMRQTRRSSRSFPNSGSESTPKRCESTDGEVNHFVCGDCGKVFNRKRSLSAHRTIHTNKKVYPCTKCSMSFTDESALTEHLRVHNDDEKPFASDEREEAIRSKYIPEERRRIRTAKPCSCSQCPSRFRDKFGLSQHMRIHNDERTSVCNDCGKSFRTDGALRIHRRMHTDGKPCACTECHRMFSQSGCFTLHVRRTHTGEKPFACDQCGKAFADVSSMRRHRLIHTGEKPYFCSKCSLAFRHTASFANHMRIHNDVKPYACDECGKAFRQSGGLTCHRRIHTGEKPYPCTKCPSGFRIKHSLARHMRVHNDEKPFICDECGASFRTDGGLHCHRRIHTGELPYTCYHCSRSWVCIQSMGGSPLMQVLPVSTVPRMGHSSSSKNTSFHIAWKTEAVQENTSKIKRTSTEINC